MTTRTLILTREFAPHKVVTWERAVLMLFQGKIRVVDEYMSDDHIVGVLPHKRHKDYRQVVQALGNRVQEGCDVVIRTPAVATLINAVGGVKRGVKFSRINVFTRDGFRCCYCGEANEMRALNYDHVVPRLQGGKTVWENIVTACYPCNSRKGSRTPEQAGMKLLRRPYKPRTLPMCGPRFDPREIPPAWLPYVVSFLGTGEVAEVA